MDCVLTLNKIVEIPINGLLKSYRNINLLQKDIITDIGMIKENSKDEYILKKTNFEINGEKEITYNQSYIIKKKRLEVPSISLINLPNIDINNTNIEFDIEILGSYKKKIYYTNQPIPNNYYNNLNIQINIESKNLTTTTKSILNSV